jgi:hypothetical protein
LESKSGPTLGSEGIFLNTYPPNVEDIFEPVTWHHQKRPFIRSLTCKTGNANITAAERSIQVFSH